MSTLTLPEPLEPDRQPRRVKAPSSHLKRELLRVIKPRMGAAMLKELQDASYYGVDTIPDELRTTDRILQRWGSSIGTGLPSDLWEINPKSRPPPLDDNTAVVVDRIVVKSPPLTYSLIIDWYKRPTPCPSMAQERRMSLKSLYYAHQVALGFMRWKFERSSHSDLIRMVNQIYAA